MGIIKPRQVVLVTTRYEGKDNIITIGWHTRVSSNPELYAIAVSKERHSYNMIKNAGSFAINFMSIGAEREARYCGSNSGRNIDKFNELELVKEECEKIDCATIKGALAIMECKLVYKFKLDNSDYSIFVGEVVNKKLISEGKRLLWSDGEYITTEKKN